MISSPSSSSSCSPTATSPWARTRSREATLSGRDRTRGTVRHAGFGLAPARSRRAQRRPGVALPPELRVDRVADLDHPVRVRWPVVAGPADGELRARGPRRSPVTQAGAGRVLDDLLGADPPHPPAVGAGQVGRQRHRRRPLAPPPGRRRPGRAAPRRPAARSPPAGVMRQPLLPAGPVRHQHGGADVVVPPVQPHLEVLVGQPLDQPLPPLDHGHRLRRSRRRGRGRRRRPRRRAGRRRRAPAAPGRRGARGR